ncbi:MAG: hypothetical protein LBG11_06845 [Bifidobacteriaceae bacterium]|nr:hypothetical protein [Bifidobacteriaceae bacterium]
MTGSILKALASGLVSAVLALVAGIWHRTAIELGPVKTFPIGLVLALVVVLGCTVAARAWAGWLGLFAAAVGAFIASQAAALPGPGGDLLIQGDWIGFTWALAAPLMAVAAAFWPRRWFSTVATRTPS